MADFDIKETYLKFLEEDKDMTIPIAAIESLVSMLKSKVTINFLRINQFSFEKY